MRTVTETYNVYKYNELSDKAKKKAKEWYLDNHCRTDDFTHIYEEELRLAFPNSELKLEYSLSYRQGDGLNIYGDLNINDILNVPSSLFFSDKFDDMIGYFTEKELRTIQHYIDVCGTEIKLPVNNFYCYCCVDRIDLVGEWETELYFTRYKNISTELLQKLQKYIIKIISSLCSEYEKYGDDFFYNVEDEVMEEDCEANGWDFLEDGTHYTA